MTGCYIIFSQKLGKFYIGITQEDVHVRLEKHNSHGYGEHRYTAAANDWELFLFIATHDYSHAVRIEKQIKKMKSKTYISNLKKYPEMIEKLKWMTRSN
jgi:putative endonuclease